MDSSKDKLRPIDLLSRMLTENLVSALDKIEELKPLKYMLEKGVNLEKEFRLIFSAIEGSNGRYWKVCRDITYQILEKGVVEQRELNKVLPYNPSTICRAKYRMKMKGVITDEGGKITLNTENLPLFSFYITIKHGFKNKNCTTVQK